MLPTRKIGALLRGKATPFQIYVGCILGACLGFMPGVAAAPGLVVALSFLLLIVNGNLLLAALVGFAAKLASLALLGVSFSAGRFLLDGPTTGFFKTLINAPVFALFGFENFTATGGLLVGTIFGALAGLAVSMMVTNFRRRMLAAKDNPGKVSAIMAKGWARWSVFLLAGGGLKDPDYAKLLSRKFGNPVRPLGIVLVLLATVLLVTVYQFFAGDIMTTALQSGLEKANGATVELASAEIDLKAGRMTLSGLAMADPNALTTDLFRATTIEADISTANVLRKRLQLDRVVVTGATSGETRRVPGRRISTAPEPSEPYKWPDAGSLEDYLQNAQVWRERLAQVQSWLDRFSSDEAATNPDGTPVKPGVIESFEEKLRRQAEAQGYASVVADHLIEGAPTLLITELRAGDVKVSQMPGESLDFVGRNLSTQPSLAPGAPAIEVTTASDKFAFRAAFDGFSAAQGDNTLAFHYRGLAVDDMAQNLKIGSDGPLFNGGTMDVNASGRFFAASGEVDLPLKIELHDTNLNIAGKSTPISSFTLPVGVTGPLNSPRLKVDSSQLKNLVATAAKDAVKQKATEKLKEKAGGLLGGFLGGSKD